MNFASKERERERRQSLSLQRCGHLIRQIWMRWTTAYGVCFKRGSTARGSMMWRSWKNVCWGSGGCWTMHTVIAAAIAQWHSRLNACIRVDGGHFKHKFWASDFLLCFIYFVDTGCPKCDRYKHVQSANISAKCVAFVSETFTRYGSNITNVWEEIFTPVTLTFSCEVVREKLWKSVNICKSYSKKISGTFFLDTVYIYISYVSEILSVK